jgi:hypothetical protein
LSGIEWRAVVVGVAAAVAIALLASVVLPPIPAAVAALFGVWLGGFLAGKRASAARVYHGALAGAGYIVCEAAGIVPTRGYLVDPLGDTLAVIASDVLLLALAAIGGWVAALSSSSGTGRAR